jgi:DNA polymerase-1
MNFSLAYGKTVYGFSKDWECSEEEARNTVALWYSDRPEVRLWQDKQHQVAERHHVTRTLLGRERNLQKHFINEKTGKKAS